MTAKATRRRKSPKRQEAQGNSAQIERNQAAIRLLESWVNVSDEEAAEQRETWEYLKQALDEERARVGARLLFP